MTTTTRKPPGRNPSSSSEERGGVGSWTISPAQAWHPSLEITVTASTTERVDTTRRNISQRLPLPGAGADGSGGRHRMSGGAPIPDLFGSCADVIRSNGSMCLVVAGKSYPINGRKLLLLQVCHGHHPKLYFRRSGPSSDTSSPPKNYGSFWNSPVSPDLVSGRVWEDFKEALSETGVLHGFGSDLRTTREVRYENRSRRFIGAVSELAPRVECMSRMIQTKVIKLG